jgi:hypothetical protein
MILHRTLPTQILWHVTRSITITIISISIITNHPFSLILLLLLLHSILKLLVLLLLIAERIEEQKVFLEVCWMLMNGVDSDLEQEALEEGWIGLCMMGWRRLEGVGPVELVLRVLVVR